LAVDLLGVAVFFPVDLLGAVFLAVDLLGAVFLAGDLLAGDFLAVDLLGAAVVLADDLTAVSAGPVVGVGGSALRLSSASSRPIRFSKLFSRDFTPISTLPSVVGAAP
jgi:hypothetical protein